MAVSRRGWRKSSFSGVEGCVEVWRIGDDTIALRDSKKPDQGCHYFTSSEWSAFLAGVRSGEFDLD